jgi:hypothetical protein
MNPSRSASFGREAGILQQQTIEIFENVPGRTLKEDPTTDRLKQDWPSRRAEATTPDIVVLYF